MKRKIALMVAVLMMASALTACSGTPSGGSTESASGSVGQTETSGTADSSGTTETSGTEETSVVKIVNDHPLTTENEKVKPYVDYINQHVYTSDFAEPAKKDANDFVVKTLSPDRPKVSIPDELKLDESTTVKLLSDLSSLSGTGYITSDMDTVVKKPRSYQKEEKDIVAKNIDVYDGEGNKIGYFDVKNLTGEDTALGNCTIVEMAVVPAEKEGTEREIMGIKPRSSLDDLIAVAGSPNYRIHFETVSDYCDVFMYYVDSEIKRSLMVKVRVDLTKDTDRTTVETVKIYNYDLRDRDK